MRIHWRRVLFAGLGLTLGLPTAVVAAFDASVPEPELQDRPGRVDCEAGALMDLGLVDRAADCGVWTEPARPEAVLAQSMAVLDADLRALEQGAAPVRPRLERALDLWRLGDRMARNGDIPGAFAGASIGLQASLVVEHVVEEHPLAPEDAYWLADALDELGRGTFSAPALASRQRARAVSDAWTFLRAGRLARVALVLWDASLMEPMARRVAAVGPSVEARQAQRATVDSSSELVFLEAVQDVEGSRNRAVGLAIATRLAAEVRRTGRCPDLDEVMRDEPLGGVLLDRGPCRLQVWDHPDREPLRVRPAGAPTEARERSDWSGQGVVTEFSWDRRDEVRRRRVRRSRSTL